MTNANTYHSMIAVLLGFAALYFVVLGVSTLTKKVKDIKRKHKKED